MRHNGGDKAFVYVRNTLVEIINLDALEIFDCRRGKGKSHKLKT